ncbi:MAG: hypothetical protein OIF48_15500 [Silicimonas sp.]|nr:hypothetical protein [Silicimonas sp.]
MSPDAWQLVLVCWGTKYGVADINRSHRAARRHSPRHARTILITDRDRPGLEDGITAAPFPEPFLNPDFKGPGCQAKLAMFADGVVPGDMPAIFTDLDSLILGDLAEVFEDHRSARDLSILQSTALPANGVTRLLHRLSNRRIYARGNSSIVAYHPEHHRDIAATFLRLHGESGLAFKPTWADERFISWAAQDHLRFADRWRAVKFTREFMAQDVAKVKRRARDTAREARRKRLVFLTLNQDVLKPEVLRTLPEGAPIEDRKGRKTEWSTEALGPFRRIIPDYLDG